MNFNFTPRTFGWPAWMAMMGRLIGWVSLNLLFSCSTNDEPRTLLDQFVGTYVLQGDVRSALSLCKGLAEEKLKGELERLGGITPGPQSRPRNVSYSILREGSTATEADFLVQISIGAKEELRFNRAMSVNLSKSSGRWKVVNFDISD